MYTKILLTLSFLIINLAHAAEIDHKIPQISLNGGYTLVPYQADHIEGFKSVVNDPAVYPSIRHGGQWCDELIKRRHNAYLEGNASSNDKYNPETFLACWVLVSPSGEIIGRGGFQPEDECQPVATEPFFAIKGEFQNQGLMKQVGTAIQDWFEKTQGSDKLLRCLTMKNNPASQHLAVTFGFTPRDDGKGQQLVITNWGKEYLVFELNGAHDLKEITNIG